MIVPQRKFDTIFEEYIDKRKKFDAFKVSSAANADLQGVEGGGGVKNEIETLKNKIIVTQRMNEIDLRHAKETAAKNANELL
jgi:hypothetical protein